MRRRKTAHERGYDSRWRKRAAAFLRRTENRWCRICCDYYGRERPSPADCVDHVVPVWVPGIDRMDEDNWQPACTACNVEKGRRDKIEYGNPGEDKYDEKSVSIPGHKRRRAKLSARNQAWLERFSDGYDSEKGSK